MDPALAAPLLAIARKLSSAVPDNPVFSTEDFRKAVGQDEELPKKLYENKKYNTLFHGILAEDILLALPGIQRVDSHKWSCPTSVSKIDKE